MTEIISLIKDVQQSLPRYTSNKNNQYNFDNTLYDSEVPMSAALEVSKRMNMSLEDALMQCDIVSVTTDASIEKAAQRIVDNVNKPSCFIVSNGSHHALVAAIPAGDNKVELIYMNSMGKMSGFRDSGLGHELLTGLPDALKKLGKESSINDLGINQQYAQCCGLSVANNIGSIVEYFESDDYKNTKSLNVNSLKSYCFQPKNTKEMRDTYEAMGQDLLLFINYMIPEEAAKLDTLSLRQKMQPVIAQREAEYKRLDTDESKIKKMLEAIKKKIRHRVKLLPEEITNMYQILKPSTLTLSIKNAFNEIVTNFASDPETQPENFLHKMEKNGWLAEDVDPNIVPQAFLEIFVKKALQDFRDRPEQSDSIDENTFKLIPESLKDKLIVAIQKEYNNKSAYHDAESKEVLATMFEIVSINHTAASKIEEKSDEKNFQKRIVEQRQNSVSRNK